MNILKKLLLVGTATGGLLVGNLLPAQANWGWYPQQRVYKISSITEADLWNYCNSLRGSTVRAWREYDYVKCQMQGSRGAVIHGQQWGQQNDFIVSRHLNRLCQRKHGNWSDQTNRLNYFVGDGGYSCYDSYRTWRR